MTEQFDPTWRFSDEDFAALGITREDFLDPVKREEIIAKIKDEANDQLRGEEEDIDYLVENAIQAIQMYPDSRVDQLARFEGEAWKAIKETTPDEEQQELVETGQYVHLMLLTASKLGEARVKMATMMDGSRRVSNKR